VVAGVPARAGAPGGPGRDIPLGGVRCGAQGGRLGRSGGVRARVPAVTARARDTTGAGDAFTGAFLAALLSGADEGDAVREGCRAGARAVEVVGGRPPRPADGPRSPGAPGPAAPPG